MFLFLLCKQNRKEEPMDRKGFLRTEIGTYKMRGTPTVNKELYLPLFFPLSSDSLIVSGHYLAIN